MIFPFLEDFLVVLQTKSCIQSFKLIFEVANGFNMFQLVFGYFFMRDNPLLGVLHASKLNCCTDVNFNKISVHSRQARRAVFTYNMSPVGHDAYLKEREPNLLTLSFIGTYLIP